jgi:type VI secretion system secreted protein VgrG
MPIKQDNRMLAIKTALGPDVLAVRSIAVNEYLSRLFQIEAELSSEDGEIDFDKVVGHPATIRLNVDQNGKRFFNGFVSRLVQVANRGGYAHYRATIVPWLWLLTRTSDCRIFQKKTIPAIIEEVFKAHGFDDYQLKLSATYAEREYVVQYRETDFNFVSRLMEQEGIYYFFQHEDGKHTLVVADSISAHKAFSGYEEVVFHPLEQGAATREAITDWTMEKEIQPGAFALNDFDFHKPKASLRTNSNVSRKYGKAQFEIYDYPGEYVETGDGERLAQARLDELQSQCEVFAGQASARGLATGGIFKLKGHARGDQNREYLITGGSVQADAGEFAVAGGSSGGEEFFSCNLTAIDKTQQFRPARKTPKPIVQGMQTAIVVGPSGETIHTDEYGRIKVQFHWDRHAKGDDNASCWIRVSQPWAGKNWGDMFIPHVGQEVVVSFEEGDPDRPIIAGRVYNPTQMPPVTLPGGKTQSVIRDHGGNETIMEGKEGSQFIHTKQTCGNEFLMDGTSGKEKIEIRDKYGNEIVLDAVKGIIRIYSPTHESEIVLGRSLEFWSVSDYKINIGGKESKVVDGSKHENILGLSSKLIAGVKQETVIGLEAKFNLVAKFELIKAYCVKKKLSKEFATVKEACVEIKNDVRATALSTMMAITNNLDMSAAKIQQQGDEVEIHGAGGLSILAKNAAMHAKTMELCGGITLTGKPVKNPSGQDSGGGALVVKGSPGPSAKPPKKRKKEKLTAAENKKKAARKAAKAARRANRR